VPVGGVQHLPGAPSTVVQPTAVPPAAPSTEVTRKIWRRVGRRPATGDLLLVEARCRDASLGLVRSSRPHEIAPGPRVSTRVLRVHAVDAFRRRRRSVLATLGACRLRPLAHRSIMTMATRLCDTRRHGRQRRCSQRPPNDHVTHQPPSHWTRGDRAGRARPTKGTSRTAAESARSGRPDSRPPTADRTLHAASAVVTSGVPTGERRRTHPLAARRGRR
jgi:hypothetical protein